MLNIGIFGAIGVEDMGDVVMLQAAVRLLEKIKFKQNKKIKLTVFSFDKELVKTQLPDVDMDINIVEALTPEELSSDTLNKDSFISLKTKKIEEIICNENYINTILECDALFFIGGGYFNKYWGNKLISTFILPIALGSKFKKDIYISGVNIGPFSEEEIERFQGVFTCVKSITIRDGEESMKVLKKLGDTNGEVIMGGDDILSRWYINPNDMGYSPDNDKDEKYAVIQLHHWAEKYSRNYIELYKNLAEFLNEILDTKEVDKVYFLPFSYFKGADYECGRRLKTFLDDREEYIVLEPTKDYIFMRQFISNAKFVIGSRYHPVVFGMGEQVPTLGIAVNDLYVQKISGAFQVAHMDLRQNMVDINMVTYKKLMEWYHAIQDKDYMNKKEINDIINSHKLDRISSIEDFINKLS